jgi:hypothetical protein
MEGNHTKSLNSGSTRSTQSTGREMLTTDFVDIIHGRHPVIGLMEHAN